MLRCWSDRTTQRARAPLTLHAAAAHPQRPGVRLHARVAVQLVARQVPATTNGFRERERNVSFNDALNTFYLRLYGVRHMVKDHSDSEREREREMFYLTTHSTHFIYGYMASDIWLRTILIVRKETRCRHMGYSY